MKLNKYILGLLIAPTLMLVGCSDYEDTEIVSPQADDSAIGANFSAASTSVVMHPDDTSFELTLNRVNTTNAITVPVTVTSCSEVSTGVKFCDQPTAFLFAAGEATAKITLNVSPDCKFQKTYKIALNIGDEKDHTYASGTSSTTVSFVKDYTWTKLGQPVIWEKGWYSASTTDAVVIIAPVEWASDYEDKVDGKMLFRIKAMYGTAFKTGNTSVGHIHFFLNSDYSAVQDLLSTNGYDPAEINTGVQQNKPADAEAAKAQKEEDKVYYNLNFTANGSGVTGGTYSEKEVDGEKVYTLETGYTFTYNVSYKDVPAFKTGVTAQLDFDIKTPTEAAKAKMKK